MSSGNSQQPPKEMTRNMLRGATEAQLQSQLHVILSFLGRMHDSDDPSEQRKVDLMREGLRKQQAAIKAERQWRAAREGLVIFGFVVLFILWFAAFVAAIYFDLGVVIAIIFWGGVLIALLIRIGFWIRYMMNKP